jgi:hypothetical protein
MGRTARILLSLLLLFTVVQALSLVRRGSRGDSDVSVFYRTSVLLDTGVGGELYPRPDPVTGWPVSLSPTGLIFFQPLARLGPLGASIGWALFNLGLLGVSLVGLRNFLRRADPALDSAFPWTAAVFILLSAGTIQVGQFSLLFVTCWILFLNAFADGRYFRAAVLLAIPTAIKVYPGMMLAVPLSMAPNVKVGARHVLLFALGMLIVSLVVPTIVYGSRAWDLYVSFWQHVILSPHGQVPFMQNLQAGANQSLDTVLLRYLSHDPEFHARFPWVPHLGFARATILGCANVARAIVLLTTIGAVWMWRTRSRTFGPHDLMMMAALWSSTLYVMLPETKARYAVYAFLGFLPLLESAAVRAAHSTLLARISRRAQIAAYVVLLLVFVPGFLRVFGVGFLGPLLLWTGNLGLVAWGRFPSMISEQAYPSMRRELHGFTSGLRHIH